MKKIIAAGLMIGAALLTPAYGSADNGFSGEVVAGRIWNPADYVPRSPYSCSSSGGYYRQESTVGYERYVVYDYNVLPDEPDWLPPGTVVIR